MIIPGKRQNATMTRRAGKIGVLEGIGRPVHARSLAVPDPEYAIDLGTLKQTQLLGSPKGGRGKILI